MTQNNKIGPIMSLEKMSKSIKKNICVCKYHFFIHKKIFFSHVHFQKNLIKISKITINGCSMSPGKNYKITYKSIFVLQALFFLRKK